jgi:hypothetical protein
MRSLIRFCKNWASSMTEIPALGYSCTKALIEESQSKNKLFIVLNVKE